MRANAARTAGTILSGPCGRSCQQGREAPRILRDRDINRTGFLNLAEAERYVSRDADDLSDHRADGADTNFSDHTRIPEWIATAEMSSYDGLADDADRLTGGRVLLSKGSSSHEPHTECGQVSWTDQRQLGQWLGAARI
jgi:hypothetical protein